MERKFYKTYFFPKAILSIRKHKLTHPFCQICGRRFVFLPIFHILAFGNPSPPLLSSISITRGRRKGKEEGRHTHNGDGRRSIGRRRRRGRETFFSARSRKEMGIRPNGHETSLFPQKKIIVALFLQHFFWCVGGRQVGESRNW